MQIVLERLNINGVEYTPFNGEYPKYGKDHGDKSSSLNGRYPKKDFMSLNTVPSSESSQRGDAEDDGVKSNLNGGDDDFITPLKGSHKAGEKAQSFSHEDAYYHIAEYLQKTKGTLPDPICIPNNLPPASSLSIVPSSDFPRAKGDKVTEVASKYAYSYDSDGKRKHSQSMSPKSSKRTKLGAKKGSTVMCST